MDVRGLNTLHTFANILGIIPTCRKTSSILQNVDTLFDRFKAMSLIILSMLGLAYNFYGKIFDFGVYVENTILLVNTLSEILVTLMNTTCIYKLNLKDGRKLRQFVEKLQSLEPFIISKDEVLVKNKRALLAFCLYNVIGVVFGCFSAYAYITTFGFPLYKYIMFREFQNSHSIVLMHLIISYAELMAFRMTELNLHLKQHVRFNQNAWIGLNGNDEQKGAKRFRKNIGIVRGAERKVFSVRIISEAYITMAELVEESNELFGMLFLIFCAAMILNIMVPVNMTLLYLRGIHLHSKSEVRVEFIGFCLFWVIFPILIGAKLLCVCNRVENEANIVPRLCYTMMKSLGNNESKLRNDLDNYGSQADRVKIKFSAGGFFNVNLGLMMPILGSVFTYLIVLMQFHHL